MHAAPIVATFHAAGRLGQLPDTSGRCSAAWCGNIDVQGRSCRRTPLELVRVAPRGGDYEMLFNGVEHRHDPRRPPGAGGRPDDLLLRPPRGAQGPRRAARGVRQAAARRPPVDRQRRPGHRLALRAEYGDDARISGSGGSSDAEKFARLRGAVGVLRAVAARRVVRRRADRGDGGRDGRGRERARRVPQRGHRWRRRAAGRAGRRRRARATALRRVLDETALARARLRAAGRGAGRASSRWRALADEYVDDLPRRSSQRVGSAV